MARILMLLRTIINTITKKAAIILIFIMLAACQPQDDLTNKRQLFVFGTVIDVVIWSDDEARASEAVSVISERFNEMHTQWHAWKPGRLQSINKQLQGGQAVKLTVEESKVLKSSLKFSQLSQGHFNPLMGAVINLWGFHNDEYPITTPPPTLESINSLLESAPQVSDIHWSDNEISSGNPNVWFDLGGIAKGYAVDVAVEILQQHGIQHAIINAGGDLRALGQKGETPWTIAIQSPKNWQPLALIKVNENEAIFTSGNYQRYKAFDGKRYAHIIDPLTYYPVSEIVSATVIAKDGMLADAAATALVVAGKKWHLVAEQMGIAEALVVDADNRCFATQAMRVRLSDRRITCETPKPLTGGL
ncbi:FAD:protein FMN transferase [Marinicella rhabdoformis]|uniref:FAD:protein FMN transferase n=1 Tax=Marinicella rhabdoformis TaxID=2580566 RepID=UPI0012AEB1F0|nr:FAD:protein FMN transferase [Marinicella rhabdoformis]